MAKFNKDRFFNNVTERVQSAINTHLLTDEDYRNNDRERLHGLIQYLILEQLVDRKFAIDVLDDFNYDDKTPWEELESIFGEFRSIKDLALVNLWKFLEAQGATEYDYYHEAATEEGTPILDIARKENNFSADDEGGDDGYKVNNTQKPEIEKEDNEPEFGHRRLQRTEDEE